MGNLVTFHGSSFVDVHDRAITSMYKHAYFVGLIFAVQEPTVKTTKIGPLKISTIRYYDTIRCGR